ncbi:MAG: phosphotransferase family protein [Deltaproteobacteria bacterium]|nr:phosphotransferase family protein [Deltaproteobacteria bacterium]MBW2400433.1 phosphotransferase family protein [Deltaproteobacteria bacterium]MBW2666064.1 phosphotransferase family protein [Deltaproteobacteria bacterium]
MSDDTEPIREPLQRWLAKRLPGAEKVRVGEFERPTGGFSAVTLLIPIQVLRDGVEHDEQVVLRMETLESAMYPAQAPGLDVEVDIQFRSMQAIRQASSVPIAPLIGYEADASVLGAPFFVMDFVPGEVPRENPIYTQQGFFAEAAPEQRRRLLEDGLRVLADIHRIDWRTADFDWLASAKAEPGMAMQLDIWEHFTRRELGDRVHPGIDSAIEWLRDRLPPDSSIGLCWGDARPGNMIWQDFRCACVTDFENISLGPPELDLGWWLMFDRWSHETYGVDRLPGEPTRDEQRDLYAGFAGRDVADTFYYELFAAVRYAAIVVRVMNRLVDRGDLPGDQRLWLQNPASTCLEQLLEST